MFPKDNYIEALLGDYAQELSRNYFTEEEGTSYLDAILFNADLIFKGYSRKQGTYMRDEEVDEGLVNSDVLHTVVLSLHPIKPVEMLPHISYRTLKALENIQDFLPLLLLKIDSDPMDIIEENIGLIPDVNYSFMQTIMGWFIT